jgi:hydrogenase/urease accessory protein HupE
MRPRSGVRRASWLGRLGLLALLLLVARDAAAHEFRPGVLSLIEEDGAYRMSFSPPIGSGGEPAEVSVVFPPGCAQVGAILRCDGPGLAGEIAIRGMQGRFMKTLVTLRRGGESEEWLLTADSARLTVRAAPHRSGLPWLRLGVEHILGGLDHLAFVIGLLLVLRMALDRRLLLTITAFTVAHSITLALAALGIVRLPIAPVEACIALSVLLVAREATHRDPTAIRRWPWLAAGGFGLIHGLGFAAALQEIGLPETGVLWSLLWFNLGVELGQLAVVTVVVGVAHLGRRLTRERSTVGAVAAHRAATYAIGGLAAWWLIDRVTGLAAGG